MSRNVASDEQYVARVLSGDTSVFRELVHKYQQPVFRFARNLIGNEHDAEEITQEVFLAAFNNLASYDATRARMTTWLFTIAKNRCVNYLKRTRPLANDDAISGIQAPAVTSNHAERNEFWKRLDDSLNELPLDQKTAFILAEIDGLPYAEIAHVEQTSLGTVKSRVHRAKQRLRAIMTPMLGEQ